MGLTDDQRALLRLLAQREEGYEDIAALKGLSVEQVRAEVKDALAEMQAAGEAPPPLPPPPAKAEEPPPPPAEPEPAQEPPAPERPLPPSPKPTPARPSNSMLPAERRRIVLLTAGALGIVAVILAAIAIFSGGSDSGPNEASGAGSGTETAATAEESGKLTQAVLEPVDGSDASGRAVFGRLGKEEIVLQVTADGLQPTDKGQSYIVWLYRSPKLTLRVGSVPVDDSGKLGARFAIPAELLAYVASGAFDQIYISRADDAAYQQEVAQAKKNKSLPRYTGETVLAGPITGPIAKTASNGG